MYIYIYILFVNPSHYCSLNSVTDSAKYLKNSSSETTSAVTLNHRRAAVKWCTRCITSAFAASAFGTSAFGASTFGASAFGASTFGASAFGASAFGASALHSVVST